MANPEQLAKLKEGVNAWNRWRNENYGVTIDLSHAELAGMDLIEINFAKVNLAYTDLKGAALFGAEMSRSNLEGADLSKAKLWNAQFIEANLSNALLCEADIRKGNLNGSNLSRSNLRRANLSSAFLGDSILTQANLDGADLFLARLGNAKLRETSLRKVILYGADLHHADLTRADLTQADLEGASLLEANLSGANLTNCFVYGISAWNVKLDDTIQSNLVITRQFSSEPVLQVDNLEMAQFINFLLNSERVRDAIDTITSKVVIILGRFTPERLSVLNAIKQELRNRDYVPVLFDFERPLSRDLTGTISTLANMAKFIIADLSDPKSVPHELAMLAPTTIVPVQTIVQKGQEVYTTFHDLTKRYHWILEPIQYESKEALIERLNNDVIGPAEAKARDLTLMRKV